jgi:hypothetical protein
MNTEGILAFVVNNGLDESLEIFVHRYERVILGHLLFKKS